MKEYENLNIQINPTINEDNDSDEDHDYDSFLIKPKISNIVGENNIIKKKKIKR